MPSIQQVIAAMRNRLRRTFEKPFSPELPDVLLPTTMVGSYPRPAWFTHQLAGRDIHEAFKQMAHAEAFEDAVRVVLKDQERAGLDILTDGQMWFDDYGAGIGSFTFYWYERIRGFESSRHHHPLTPYADQIDAIQTEEWGAAAVTGPVERGPLHLAELFQIAQMNTQRPIRFCVGAGPANLCLHCHYEYYKKPRELAEALAPIYNAEMLDLVKAGARFLQLEDMGVWIPTLTGSKADYKWIRAVLRECLKGVKAKIGFHFCRGNCWGNASPGLTGVGYGDVLPQLFDLPIHQFVLDFASLDMADVDVLKDLPAETEVAAGVIDVRTTQIETPVEIADRIRKVLAIVPPERLTLTTDCGMKQLPRFCAAHKLRALVEGTRLVRRELTG